MGPTEAFRIAIRGLQANRLRATLTMLGIVIGVAAVIAMLSIGRGAQASITSQITSMGTNLLFVRPGASSSEGVRSASGSQETLTLDDANALVDPVLAPDVVAAAPQSGTFGQIVFEGNNTNSQVVGITQDYATVRNLTLSEGEFITSDEVEARSLVAVLGATIVTSLFNDIDPVGESIRVNGMSFKVIGVLAAKGGTGQGSSDDQILIPLTTLQTRLSGRTMFRGASVIQTINVQVTSSKAIGNATQEIAAILRDRHNILYEDDFSIQSQEDMLASASQISGVLTIFLGGVAAISLLVGGIGIMNIMLVSVTERTREIGVRKAVGARKRDVLGQFLTEAVLLSLAGGAGGILLGIGASRLLSGMSIGGSSFTTVVGVDFVVLAAAFSMAVGLFFGIYPAQRAASLRPIEALRYE
jgi:putative ABC transport system permease protein